MKQFVERLQKDKEFAAEFREFMLAKNGKVKEGTKLIGEQLNKLVVGSIKEFAASKGIALKDDEQTSKSLASLSKQICLQMDDMIVKSFKSLEGTMKQPMDIPPEMVKVIRDNAALYDECMHKADAAVEAAVQKCFGEMNTAVMASMKEFAEKTGYQGAYPSTGLNKDIAKKINAVIETQFKGLMQVTKTTT